MWNLESETCIQTILDAHSLNITGLAMSPGRFSSPFSLYFVSSDDQMGHNSALVVEITAPRSGMWRAERWSGNTHALGIL
jgi:hypothetical protein